MLWSSILWQHAVQQVHTNILEQNCFHLEATLQMGVVRSSEIFVPRIAVCGVITQKTTIHIAQFFSWWLLFKYVFSMVLQIIAHFIIDHDALKVSQTPAELGAIKLVLAGVGGLQVAASWSHEHESGFTLVNISPTWICFTYCHSIFAAETQAIQVILRYLCSKITYKKEHIYITKIILFSLNYNTLNSYRL